MDKQRSQQFMNKLVGDVATALAASLVVVGDRAGLWKAMSGAGACSAAQLSRRSGVHPRYVEEWLGAMAGAGYVEHDAAADTYTLPEEHALFLTDPQSEYHLIGLFASLPALAAMAPRIGDAARRGEGVSFADFGAELPLALERMNRPVYEKRLVKTWLPALPEVLARLQAGGRALDVGCGTGVVPVTIAKALPAANCVGLDIDAPSIEIARGYAREAGVDDRVRFVCDRLEHALAGGERYDLVTTFDVVHDLPDPLGALKHIRGALADDGVYLMVEPRVGDSVAANAGSPFARMFYGMSCLHCVPQSLAQGGPGLGACWGERRARALAHEAGFAQFQPLEVRTAGLAFYALRR